MTATVGIVSSSMLALSLLTFRVETKALLACPHLKWTHSELKQSDVRPLYVELTDVEDFEFEHCVYLCWGIKCSLQSRPVEHLI